ncbi:hypothetical protein Ari01nite_97620 [Paractinoplanes rishiriensis]|uniref:Uncharacterized protein n=2 Tax=Paractinoplanes rishiriensis TaxID=1050105 RepID=A0A919KBF8_9ACTN|nr:hypothetical protein Ari01nite_97620 [Actinoplanes rishiriensis]
MVILAGTVAIAAVTVLAVLAYRSGATKPEQHAVGDLLTDPADELVHNGKLVRLSMPDSWRQFNTVTLVPHLSRLDGDKGGGSCIAPASMTVIPVLDDKDLPVIDKVKTGQAVPVGLSGTGHKLQMKIEVRLSDDLCRLRLGGSIVFE